MPILDTERVIKEYYETIKDQYSHIDLEWFIKICKNPFWHFNKAMAREDLPTIHIKNLGRLVVMPDNIKKLLRNNNSDLKFNSVTPEKHKEIEERLLGILKEIERDENQIMEITED